MKAPIARLDGLFLFSLSLSLVLRRSTFAGPEHPKVTALPYHSRPGIYFTTLSGYKWGPTCGHCLRSAPGTASVCGVQNLPARCAPAACGGRPTLTVHRSKITLP